MRALKNIDVAFVCMNLPYTMTPDEAADAVKEFHPKIAIPYHYRGSDITDFPEESGRHGSRSAPPRVVSEDVEVNWRFRPVTPELQRALERHTQWFGSYKASGELKKIQVWLILNGGRIEFLTAGNSYKVKRVRKNPRVVCYVGSKDGPAISGTAQIISERNEVARVYRSYWKVHPLRMALLIGLRVWIEMLLNNRVVVRVQPDEPNLLAGLSDPAT